MMIIFIGGKFKTGNGQDERYCKTERFRPKRCRILIGWDTVTKRFLSVVCSYSRPRNFFMWLGLFLFFVFCFVFFFPFFLSFYCSWFLWVVRRERKLAISFQCGFFIFTVRFWVYTWVYIMYRYMYTYENLIIHLFFWLTIIHK